MMVVLEKWSMYFRSAFMKRMLELKAKEKIKL